MNIIIKLIEKSEKLQDFDVVNNTKKLIILKHKSGSSEILKSKIMNIGNSNSSKNELPITSELSQLETTSKTTLKR